MRTSFRSADASFGRRRLSPITREAVSGALPAAQDILDEEFFDNRVEGATNEERRYMAAMADLGDGPQTTATVTERAGYKKRTSSGKAGRH